MTLKKKCTERTLCTLRNPAFENKAGWSLSHDSLYLRLGTVCSSEHKGLGDEATTTER